MSHFPPVHQRDLDPFFSSHDKDFWLSSSWSHCCAQADTSCWIIEARALKHTTLLFLSQPPHLCGHMINYSTPGWCHFTMPLLPALLFFKLSLDWLFLSSWSFYFCWMNQHLHSLASLTDVYLKIINTETHSWPEPASSKSGRAEYIRHISGLLWSYCLTGQARKGLCHSERLGLWDPLTGRVVGPLPWFFQCCLRFSLNQLVILDSTLS